MAKPKRKLLPKDFEEQLQRGDLEQLKAIFDTCDLHARGSYSKQTALAFDECPDQLTRWLVAQGADIDAPDQRGDTPLHARAGSWHGPIGILIELGAGVHRTNAAGRTPLHAAAARHHADNARLLIEQGARVDAKDNSGLTALELALRTCANSQLEYAAPLVEVLLAAGAKKSALTGELVATLGKNFEFHRIRFNPDSVDTADAALKKLYALFDVAPVPRRQLHDNAKPIVVKAKTWAARHAELWQMLIPSAGAAATVQGEVIRITGRLWRELEGNGGANWHEDFKLMADAFLEHVHGGTPLPTADLAQATRLVAAVKRKSDDSAGLARLAVKWVLLNPQPVLLAPPAYQR